MPIYSDDSPEATAMAAQQAERLRRLRSAVAKSQAAAARAAGVSKDAWNRMELGTYRINALALARFGQTYDIPTEYVISGRLIGLPEHLNRVVAALEARDAAAGPPQVLTRVWK
jgi:transcriptional regulator with XRE-family HTH domain